MTTLRGLDAHLSAPYEQQAREALSREQYEARYGVPETWDRVTSLICEEVQSALEDVTHCGASGTAITLLASAVQAHLAGMPEAEQFALAARLGVIESFDEWCSEEKGR